MSEATRDVTPQQARELMARIAASPDFARSPRLRDLLRYIVEAWLDNGRTINEQQIGVDVFGRQRQYDSGSDTIVRVQISQLRKRLEHYFLTDGQQESVVLEIPRGSYTAVFQVRAPAHDARGGLAAETEPLIAPHTHAPGQRWLVVFLAAGMSVLAIVCGILAWRVRVPESQGADTPAVRRLWSNLVRQQQKTTVVLADSVFGFVQDTLGVQMDLDNYLQSGPQQWIEGAKADPKLAKALEMLAFRQYTSIGDVAVARQIVSANLKLQEQIRIVFARNFNARGTASENIILLGSRRSNPWAQLYVDRLNFYFDYDTQSRKAVIRNRNPRPGEAAKYSFAGEGPAIKEGYAVIAFLPNGARTANILMLAGTDMEATEAVGHLVTTEGDLARVLAKICPGDRLPFFEAVFHTRRLGGAPQECSLEAWREIAGP